MIIYSVDGQIILNPSQSPVPSFLGSCVPEDPRMSLIAQQTWKIPELQVSIAKVWIWGHWSECCLFFSWGLINILNIFSSKAPQTIVIWTQCQCIEDILMIMCVILWKFFPAIVQVSDQRLEADMARTWGGKDNYYVPLMERTKDRNPNNDGFSSLFGINDKIVLWGEK